MATCYLNLDDMKLTLATNGFYNVVCSFCQITLCRWIACMQLTLYIVVGTMGEGGSDCPPNICFNMKKKFYLQFAFTLNEFGQKMNK